MDETCDGETYHVNSVESNIHHTNTSSLNDSYNLVKQFVPKKKKIEKGSQNDNEDLQTVVLGESLVKLQKR